MKATPCCDANYKCVPWGETFSMCREADKITCSKDGEWCANNQGAHIAPRGGGASKPSKTKF